MNYFFALLFTCILISCSNNNTPINKNKDTLVDEKKFLDHEILNDSIHYRIKEYKKRNHIYRNICVFNKAILLEESLIYKTQKKDLMDEGYFVKSKKLYEVNEQNKLTLFDIKSHYHDYNLDSEDTTISQLIVTSEGKIEIKKASLHL